MTNIEEIVQIMEDNCVPWATNDEHQQSRTVQAEAIVDAGFHKDLILNHSVELDELDYSSVILANNEPLIKTDEGTWRDAQGSEWDSFDLFPPFVVLLNVK